MRVLILLFAFYLCGCTTIVDEDYAKYLSNNRNFSSLSKVDLPSYYQLDSKSQTHIGVIKLRNPLPRGSWIIRFAPIVDLTLSSQDYQNAFGKLSQAKDLTNTKEYLSINLLRYDFKKDRAFIALELISYKNNKRDFRKVYFAEGKPQAGKIFWAGSSGLKNAIQQSTMIALNDIFENFSRDYKIHKTN